MATGQTGMTKPVIDTFKAAADLSSKQWYFCKLSAANTVNVTSANTDIPQGIIMSTDADAANESVAVIVDGQAKLKLGGTVTRGTYIMSHTDGTGVAATNNKPSPVLARESGVADDIITVQFHGGYVSSS